MEVFNNTDFNQELFTNLNSVLQISIFFTISLPTIVLNGVCAVAMALSKTINWKMKVAIFNIFIAEFTHSMNSIFYYLGYPIRTKLVYGYITCYIEYFFVVVGTLSSLAAISLYAIATYLFIKHGPRRLKKNFLFSYIAISWIISIVIGLVSSIFDLQESPYGFCNNSMDNLVLTTIIYDASIATIAVWIIVSLLLISIFGILTFCYVKENTIQDNAVIKKVIAKNLLFLSIKVFVIVITYIILVCFDVLEIFEERTRLILDLAVGYIVHDAIYDILSLSTPIAALIILRPLRVAIKEIVAKLRKICCHWKMCCRCKNNAVHPSPQSKEIEKEEAF